MTDETEMLDEGEVEAVDEAAAPESEQPVDDAAASVAQEATAPPTVEVVRNAREFHISGNVVKESAATEGMSNDDARKVLQTMYPEVANATIRETNKDGVVIVEFLPQPGRKG